jgi:hypothetical protein
VFPVRYELNSYILCRRNSVLKGRVTRVEAGSNISTVALRVVGGDGKGSPESETVKYCMVTSPTELGTPSLARARSRSERQTRPLVRESAPYKQTRRSMRN